MKKPEIKRRKRVVPAGDAAPHLVSLGPGSSQSLSNVPNPSVEHADSPDPSTTVDSQVAFMPDKRVPLAIDFTHYYGKTSSDIATTLASLTTYVLQPGASSPRKRSRSATSIDLEPAQSQPKTPASHRPNAISAILNHPGVEDDRIDPSLSATPPTNAVVSTTSGTALEDKATKKERLKKEADLMRQELERKQRELDDLEND